MTWNSIGSELFGSFIMKCVAFADKVVKLIANQGRKQKGISEMLQNNKSKKKGKNENQTGPILREAMQFD